MLHFGKAGAVGRSVVCACAMFLGFGTMRSHAQGIDDAIRQQQQILRQQEEQRQEQLRQLRERAPAAGAQTQQDQDVQADQSKVCFKVHKIEFIGAELLDAEIKAQVKAPFEGTCMTIVDILSIARVVTNWYVGKGYVTSRAFPPAQDLKSGVLKIQVVEGRVEDVDVLTNGELRTKPVNAFPPMAGERLNIRDIEQGLDQINRLPTHSAKIHILPAQKEGHSRIQVDDAASGLPITISTIDNFGATATGRWQLGNVVRLDDVLGLYDGWTLSHTTSSPFYDDKSSSSYFASATVPFGYWSLLVAASYFDYETQITGVNQDFLSEGDTLNITAEVERVLHRDQISKTRLAGYVTYKENENFIEGARIDVQSRKLNVAGLRLSHNRRVWDGVADLSLAVERGVPMFGSLDDDDRRGGEPKAEFTKLVAEGRYFRPFSLAEQNFVWNVKAKGQWSPDELFTSEQLGVGGQYSVRGFHDESLSGDNGAYLRNELAWIVPQFHSSPELTKWFGSLELFAAIDAGWVDNHDDEAEGGGVAGVAAGARLVNGVLFGEAVWEHNLEAPDFLLDEGDIFRAQAGLLVRW